MATKYDYNRPLNIDEAEDVKTALWFTIVNYMHHQLGWDLDDCKKRLERELARELPSAAFDQMEQIYGWKLNGSTLLDVGAGQGGTVLEALFRVSDAWGIEPGEEFCKVGKSRLDEANFNKSRMKLAGGENIPFPDNYFDYIISLQVMEHVDNPQVIMKEMYRVLKPNGKCFITCANYLSFWEGHYYLPWLPLLPKNLGSTYLNLLGRDPHFLKKYVYYTTYPQMWRISKKVGFHNITYETLISHHLHGKSTKLSAQIIIKSLNRLPSSIRDFVLKTLLHCKYFFAHGIRLVLKKPY